MSTVLLLTLLFISIIMTGLILIQQSEGGALGIGGGGGGGGGGFMSGRSAANSVSKMTGILGVAFLVCCLMLSIVFNKENQSTSILDEANLDAPLTSPLDSAEETDPLADVNLTPQTDAAAPAETNPSAVDDSPEAPKDPERE